MGILLAFLPFLAFALVERLAGTVAGLVTAAGVSAVLLARDVRSPGKKVKILEVGTMLLFGGLAAYALLTGATWSLLGVRLRVDMGLLLIVLVSLALRQPFTLQYAREQTPRDIWDRPEFVRSNYVITAVWAAAFAVIVAADLLLLSKTTLPPSVGILATVAAIFLAARFTAWYPTRSA